MSCGFKLFLLIVGGFTFGLHFDVARAALAAVILR